MITLDYLDDLIVSHCTSIYSDEFVGDALSATNPRC